MSEEEKSLVEKWYDNLGGERFPKDTTERVEKYFKEMEEKREYSKFTAFETNNDEMIIINQIKIFSFCEHHLLPFFGHCSIGYIPNGKILGLSKFQRLVDSVATRPTLQEDVTQAIANRVQQLLSPKGLGVIANCQHSCMFGRGIERPEIYVSTQVLRGEFKDIESMRNEFLGRARSDN
jgi:GTP cyclohydrolase I